MNKKLKKILRWTTISLTTILFLTFTIPFLIPVSKAGKLNNIKPFDNSEFTICNDIELHYRVWKNQDSVNSDKWILMLHGMGGSTYSWVNNAQVFCDSGYNVVAVDIPPYGYSGKNEDFNYSTDNIARLIWKFAIRFNRDTKWILIGHSMGGGIAQCMAILKPERTSKVIFVAPALFNKIEPGRSFSQRLSAFSPVERIMTVMGEYYFLRPKKIKKILESSFAGELSDTVANQYYLALNNDGFTRAFLRSFSKSNPTQVVDGMNFKTESIAFFGTKDTWVPYERIKPITDKLPIISVIIVENAGHSLMETHFAEFNKTSLDFIKK
ncbi:MAG: alpha/beta hydrolase [Bacteroidales bacterium]|nr:alpha/beta hydrolase [Bacteroidales bacterium]